MYSLCVFTVNWSCAYFIALRVSREFILQPVLMSFHILVTIISKLLVTSHIMFFRLSVFQSFVDLVFCQCPCALSTFYMLASVSGLCRAESSINQVLVSTLSPSHVPRCSGSSWLRKPSDVYSSVNSWLLRLTQPIVLRLLLFLGTICICVDSIACPFELTWRVSLTYYCECTWHLPQLNFAVPETYCDGVAQTELPTSTVQCRRAVEGGKEMRPFILFIPCVFIWLHIF